MELYSKVKLIKQFDTLAIGLIGTIVEVYDEHNYEVEFLTIEGEWIGCYTLSDTYLELL